MPLISLRSLTTPTFFGLVYKVSHQEDAETRQILARVNHFKTKHGSSTRHLIGLEATGNYFASLTAIGKKCNLVMMALEEN